MTMALRKPLPAEEIPPQATPALSAAELHTLAEKIIACLPEGTRMMRSVRKRSADVRPLGVFLDGFRPPERTFDVRFQIRPQESVDVTWHVSENLALMRDKLLSAVAETSREFMRVAQAPRLSTRPKTLSQAERSESIREMLKANAGLAPSMQILLALRAVFGDSEKRSLSGLSESTFAKFLLDAGVPGFSSQVDVLKAIEHAHDARYLGRSTNRGNPVIMFSKKGRDWVKDRITTNA